MLQELVRRLLCQSVFCMSGYFFSLICPVAIAKHETDYKIAGVASVCLSVLSVCRRSCGRNFESNLVKLCTVVWDIKTQIEFVRGQNPIMLPLFYSPIFTARCTLVQSAVLPSHVVCLSVCLSVCNVGEL